MVDEWEASITQTEATPAEPVIVSHVVPQTKMSAEGNQTVNSTSNTPGRDSAYPASPVGGVIRTVIDNIIEVIPKTLLPSTIAGSNSTSTKAELNRYRYAKKHIGLWYSIKPQLQVSRRVLAVWSQ